MPFKNNSAIVYLIDDELAIRESLACLIKTCGLTIRCYASAADFLSDYQPELPGCLILDVRMPFMGGLDLQQELINREMTLPIIFISGNADIPDTAKAFRAGALDFFEKPFDNALLLERVYEALHIDIESRKQSAEKNNLRACFDSLTVREKEVLKLIIAHNSTKKVAKQLDISPRTIEAHRAHILEKMHAENIVDLVTKMAIYPELISS